MATHKPRNPNINLTTLTIFLAAVRNQARSFPIFGVGETPSLSTSSRARPSIRELLRIDLAQNRASWRLTLDRLFFLSGVYGIQVFAQYFIRDTLSVADPVQLTGDLLATIVLTLIGFSLLAGYLSDRYGRKPLHIAASTLITVGSLAMIFAGSAGTILIFDSVIGAGIGCFLSAKVAWANDLAPADQAGKFLGLTNLATAGAGALSRLAGPGFDALNTWRPGKYWGYDGLYIAAAIATLVSVVVMSTIPEGKGKVTCR